MTTSQISRQFTFAPVHGLTAMGVLLAALLWLISVAPAQGQTVVATLPADFRPGMVVANPVTDKIYVSNFGASNITVIDGATNSTSRLSPPGLSQIQGIAVNSLTNKIYAADFGNYSGVGGGVKVIDAATYSSTTVSDPRARGPFLVTVNLVTNKIYVANWLSANITVIDGATNSFTTVRTGVNPHCIAVNPLTDKIYVTNWGSDSVTVIDGATNSTTTVRDTNASVPNMVVVNLVTNKIYVSNYGSNNVTVIDGATNSITTVTDPYAIKPSDIALNPLTNKIYVANYGSNNVTVIDGATNSTTTLTDPNATGPFALAVNPETNRVYVTNYESSNVTVIAGAAPVQTFRTLAIFDRTNGSGPSSLVQGTDGNFYGTTQLGGGTLNGNVFKITPGGTLTTLYSFCSQPNCPDGEYPSSGLIQATDGNFYGATGSGGGPNYAGTIFKITPAGKLTTLYSFCAQTNCSDGAKASGALVQATDGSFYGVTSEGGDVTCNCGTVFKITPLGALTTLHRFKGTDGVNPTGLIQAVDGNLYGTTLYGGVGYGVSAGGTVFRITPAGKLTTLHTFCNSDCTDGDAPASGVVQATDGNYYGTTLVGGAYGSQADGTVFKITPQGEFTTLHSFDSPYGHPYTGLVQATNGSFYGTTFSGGTNRDGTVFRLSTGLGPFVSFIRGSGKVGQTVQILGQGFTGTTKVSFNGTRAAFTVKSDTYLTATVPAGASTGFVTVTTPGGTLGSNQKFRVTPQILGFSPTSGPMGTRVVITGKSFRQASVVTLACKWKMSFTVDSDTQITAIVPQGATSGRIAVSTPGGRAESTASFTVTD